MEAVAPSLMGRLSVAAAVLACLSALVRYNRHTALALYQEISQACSLTYLCKAEAISPSDDVIKYKVLPILVGALTEDSVVVSVELRTEAARVLGCLLEGQAGLQRQCAFTRQCLQGLAARLTTFHLAKTGANAAALDALEAALLDTLAVLAHEEEEIRRKLSQEHAQVLESSMRLLKNPGDRALPVRLAALRLLHSLSRSVEQLRTAFQDHSDSWLPLLNIIHKGPRPLAEVAAAILANLVLEFSPAKESLLEAGALDVLVSLARQDEENLCLSGVWGLQNLSYRASDRLKANIMRAFGVDEVTRLLTAGSPGSPVVPRLLGLVRNLVATSGGGGGGWLCDGGVRSAGDQQQRGSIAFAIVYVLETDFPLQVKELALTILANLAAGEAAKELILSNDDVLGKILNYLMGKSPRLQAIALACVDNLLSGPDADARFRRLRDLGFDKVLAHLHFSPDTPAAHRLKNLQSASASHAP